MVREASLAASHPFRPPTTPTVSAGSSRGGSRSIKVTPIRLYMRGPCLGTLLLDTPLSVWHWAPRQTCHRGVSMCSRQHHFFLRVTHWVTVTSQWCASRTCPSSSSFLSFSYAHFMGPEEPCSLSRLSQSRCLSLSSSGRCEGVGADTPVAPDMGGLGGTTVRLVASRVGMGDDRSALSHSLTSHRPICDKTRPDHRNIPPLDSQPLRARFTTFQLRQISTLAALAQSHRAGKGSAEHPTPREAREESRRKPLQCHQRREPRRVAQACGEIPGPFFKDPASLEYTVRTSREDRKSPARYWSPQDFRGEQSIRKYLVPVLKSGGMAPISGSCRVGMIEANNSFMSYPKPKTPNPKPRSLFLSAAVPLRLSVSSSESVIRSAVRSVFVILHVLCVLYFCISCFFLHVLFSSATPAFFRLRVKTLSQDLD